MFILRITKFFSLSLFLCVSLSAHAEAPSPVIAAFTCAQQIESVRAKEIVSSVQKNFAQVKSMRAQFFQDSYLASVDQSELSSGNVTLLLPGKMRWHYLSPEEQIFIVKDNSLWLYQPRLQQVVIDSLETVLISQLPTAFLMGVGDLTRDFEVKSACETKTALLLSLVPVKDSKEAQDLAGFDLLVDKGSYLPMGAQVLDVGANRTSILMRALVVDDKTVANKEFEFSAPAGSDIDDRRAAAPR